MDLYILKSIIKYVNMTLNFSAFLLHHLFDPAPLFYGLPARMPGDVGGCQDGVGRVRPGVAVAAAAAAAIVAARTWSQECENGSLHQLVTRDVTNSWLRQNRISEYGE